MTPLSGVLFDWRGTLVTVLDPRDWVREALRRLGRAADDDATAVLREAIRSAAGHPDRLASPDCDTSMATHRRTYYGVFADAGLDGDLADALYAVESDPSYNEFALDVAPAIRRLAAAGVKVGVVSDIHFDLRPSLPLRGSLPRSMCSFSPMNMVSRSPTPPSSRSHSRNLAQHHRRC
jgi:phosphoglycolate phosphatase-like HAD superfamily hydrolase